MFMYELVSREASVNAKEINNIQKDQKKMSAPLWLPLR